MNDTQQSSTHAEVAAGSGLVFCPTFRCVDAPRAIEWLIDAFGFERQAG